MRNILIAVYLKMFAFFTDKNKETSPITHNSTFNVCWEGQKRMLKAYYTSPKSIQLLVSAQKSWPKLILLQIKVRKKEAINFVPSPSSSLKI